MKQGNKIVSYVVLLSIVFVMIQTVSLFGIFRVAFRNVEKFVARKNLQFCVNSLQVELKHLEVIAFEWSAWDDTGMFIEGKVPQYVGENMSELTLREKKIDVICILDNQGKLVWSRTVKNSGGESRDIELEMFAPENLQKNASLWNHKNVNDCISGFYSTEGGVLMLSSRPVTNNTNSPPIHGSIIIGRFLSDQMIASIARQTCLDFKWWNLHSDYTRKTMAKYLSQITPQKPVYVEFEIDSAAAYTILQDIHKNDAILVKFLMNNELMLYRDQMMIKSTGLYFLEGFLFLFCLALAVNQYCKKYFSLPSMNNADTVSDVEFLSFEQMSDVQYSNDTAPTIEEEKQPI